MNKLIYCSFMVMMFGCRDIYNSPVKPIDTGFLVVEGIVNSGQGATTIKLSRSANLSDNTLHLEENAQVRVEGDDNTFYPLFENNTGQYTGIDLNLPNNKNYRLNIRTSTGKQYFSDFIKVKNNPPIDSISFKKERDGLQVYVQTHDPMDTTWYYQWEYVETWEFHSRFPSVLKYVYDSSGNVTGLGYKRPWDYSPDSSVYYCWQTDTSHSIQIGSSAKLSKDEIYLPLNFIPPGSWKLSVLYSIKVRQYSITKDGYEFLSRMKKNTEATGSIFDPQPSTLVGNIHCATDPAEQVIGYINICPVQEKRIFIRNDEIPDWIYDPDCPYLVLHNPEDVIRFSPDVDPAFPTEIDLLRGIVKYEAALPRCIDCTLSGTNVKPTFWP